MKIDELRIIEHTNTQVRCLSIVSQVMRTIGSRSSSLSILSSILKNWSIEQERNSVTYRNHNGILTNNEKPTTAFTYYIELALNFGFITKINEVVRNSKFGTLFLIIDKYSNKKEDLSDIEKLFFLFFILLKDADNVILILNIIKDNKGIAEQSFLRGKYEEYLKKRLILKANNSYSFSQNAILDKLRKVEYVWQNAKEYSKHIIPPRIEWLVDLEILILNDENRVKRYEFTDLGHKFYDSLELIDYSDIKDINDIWLVDKFIHVFKFILENKNEIANFDTLDEISRNKFLFDILPLAYKELDSDGIRRVSSLPFYIFVMIVGVVRYNISISLSSIKEKLSHSFSTLDYTFSIRNASRINESYLTVNINNI